MTAAIALLKARRPDLGKVGVMGFCMGGRVAYLMASANAGLSAAAVFYGGGILQPWGDPPTPFERTSAINCPVIGFFGEQDTNPSPADVSKIDAEMTRFSKWHEFHMYRDTGHAFHNFLNPERYRERAARASWGELLAFFDQNLKGS
jgi:carboxymethylenebutenolidase